LRLPVPRTCFWLPPLWPSKTLSCLEPLPTLFVLFSFSRLFFCFGIWMPKSSCEVPVSSSFPFVFDFYDFTPFFPKFPIFFLLPPPITGLNSCSLVTILILFLLISFFSVPLLFGKAQYLVTPCTNHDPYCPQGTLCSSFKGPWVLTGDILLTHPWPQFHFGPCLLFFLSFVHPFFLFLHYTFFSTRSTLGPPHHPPPPSRNCCFLGGFRLWELSFTPFS